ncbi:MAG: hypothetical protein ACREYA_04540 [Cupriavidus necator]
MSLNDYFVDDAARTWFGEVARVGRRRDVLLSEVLGGELRVASAASASMEVCA